MTPAPAQIKERQDSILHAIVAYSLLFGTIALAKMHSYHLFHVFVEGFSIVVACGIFMVAWHSRRYLENSYFLVVGVAYLFVAMIDLLHTMSYEGMGINLRHQLYPNAYADPAIEFWIAGRYLESLSLLAAILVINRKVRPWSLLYGYALLSTGIFVSIYRLGWFPYCFMRQGSPDPGLTHFKIASEYIIAGIMIAVIVLLWRRREYFAPRVLRLLIISSTLTIVAEMAFTLYTDMFGIFNIVGHYCKLLSFFLIYKAVIQTGLEEPYKLLFRELKEREDELEHERDFIATVLDTAPALIAVIAPDGTIVRCNVTWEIFTGQNSADVAGVRWVAMFKNQDAQASMEEALHTTLQTGGAQPTETVMPGLDGTNRHVAWSFAALKRSGDGIEYVIAIGTDITEQREAELALIRAERMAALGDLASGVAHHFNNLHAGVLGHLDLFLSKDYIEEHDRKRLTGVRDAVAKASHITQGLLTFTGKRSTGRCPLSINDVVNEAVTLLESTLANDNVSVHVEYGDSKPVMADPAELHQVVVNLIINAWHAMTDREEKSLRVATGQDGDRVFIRIADTGCGIAPEDLPRIFTPMFSLKGEHAHEGNNMQSVRGTGLGLSISDTIVREHGGEISVESTVNVGTTMTVWLPIWKR